MFRLATFEHLAGLLFVLVLHAAALWGLWQHRLIPAPQDAMTLFVNFIAPPAPPKAEEPKRPPQPRPKPIEKPQPRQIVAEAPVVAPADYVAPPPPPKPAPVIEAPAPAADAGDVLTRSLNNAIDQEMTRAEHGLTILATAGSAAPYIGLFGTVWGIYHALVQIGLSGQGTLDKVAGPVGEALIMTALGLAVAIPAVLAYNAFQRRNRMWLSRLETFAHGLYLRMMTHGQG
jgi:multisubunit Na+/H+ antiporter MnhC subunit